MATNKEHHFTAADKVRDVVIGLSDGLTVPFALAAGLTGAITASKLVITAGLAEIVAGSISMGLGGYLAAKNDMEHYRRERALEEQEVVDTPKVEEQEVRDILAAYQLTKAQADPILAAFAKNHRSWVNFMMSNELGLQEPKRRRIVTSPITIGASYAIGGLVPLSPYFFITNAHQAVIPSAVLTLIALFTFGFYKAYASGTNAWRSGLEMVAVGGVAAGAAYFLARAIS